MTHLNEADKSNLIDTYVKYVNIKAALHDEGPDASKELKRAYEEIKPQAEKASSEFLKHTGENISKYVPEEDS